MSSFANGCPLKDSCPLSSVSKQLLGEYRENVATKGSLSQDPMVAV